MGVSYNVPLREDQIFEKAKGDIDRHNLATLTSAIHTETENRQSADANLQADIAALNTALSDEITLRANDDYELKQEYTAKITQEKLAREQADADLQAALQNETSVRQTQTESLGSALQNEIAARTAADTALKAELNGNLSNEAVLRASEDNKLNQKIDALRESIPQQQTLNIKEFVPSSESKDGEAGLVPAPPKSTQKQLLTNQGWEELSSTDIFIGAVPSQSGQPSYTGNVIYPQWLNYEDQKLTIAGQTSGTNVGTYTVTFTPRGLYCWSDGTRDARTVTWQIYKATVPIPTAAVTSYEYTGSNVTLSVTNYDANVINQTGTVTAKNAGNYTATYKLKDSANNTWADGSTSDKNISWSIGAKKLAKPYASNTNLNYTGNTVTLTVANVDFTYMNKSGNDSATAAGNYSVTYSLKDTTNYQWSDGSTAPVKIDWSISNSSLGKPTAAVTSFDYTGSQISLNITGFDAATMNKSGDDSAINAGNYTVTISLKDKNSMKWSDGTTSDVTISWTINRIKMPAAYSYQNLTVQNVTYDGNGHSVRDLFNFSATYHKFVSGTTVAVPAGNYKAVWEPAENYLWSDGTSGTWTADWSILRKQITKPTAEKTAFDYDGAVKTLSFKNYNSALMTKTGTDSASAKGTYTVTFTLNDNKNYAWADGTTAAVTITWSIGATAITKPKLTGTTSFTYDGNAKSVTVSGYDSSTMTFSGTISETSAGNYTAKYSLKDKNSYAWDDGTTDDVILSWNIAPKKLTAAQSPTFSMKQSVYTWDGVYAAGMNALIGNMKIGESQINNFDSSYHRITGGTYSYLNTYTSKYTINDTFTIQISPIANHCWSDGTTAAKVVSFKITEKLIPKPSAATTSFAYDGTTKNLTVSNYVSNYMKQSGNLSGTNVGSYSATYSLYPAILGTSNMTYPYFVKWEDGTTDDVTIDWQITSGSGIAKPTLSKTEYEWTGGNISPTVSGYNSASMNQGGTSTATNIGTYTVTYSLKDKNNTKWSDGTTADVTLTWKIVRQKLANDLSIDTATTLTYNGSTQEPKFKYGSVQWTLANLSSYCDLSSQTSAVDAGTYKIVATPKSTYAWKDGTYAAKTFSWTINQIAVTQPSIQGVVRVFNYDGQEHSPAIVYDTTIFKQVGTASAVNAGHYTFDLALVDEVNYKITGSFNYTDDGTKCYRYSWTINKASQTVSVDKTEVTIVNPNTSATINVTYNGESWQFTIDSNPDSFMNNVRGGGSQLVINVNNLGVGKITIQSSETANYAASNAVEITVNSQYVKSLASCSWEQVETIAASGYASNGWNAGDYKEFSMKIPKVDSNGTVTNTTSKYRAVLLGLDHNSEETRHFADFMILDSDGKALRFDNYRDGSDSNTSTVATYNGTEVVSFLCNSALTIKRYLPDDLISVIHDAHKTTWNHSTGNTPNNSGVLTMFDLSPGEIRRGADSGNTAPYDYFLNGNGIPTPVTFWTRVYTSASNTYSECKGLACIYSTVAFVERAVIVPMHGIPCFRI